MENDSITETKPEKRGLPKWMPYAVGALGVLYLLFIVWYMYAHCGNVSLWVPCCLCACAVVCLICIPLLYLKWPIARATLVAILLLGAFSNAIILPMDVPDEPAHASSAYRFSSMLLGEGYFTDEGKMLKRAGDLDLTLFTTKPTLETYEDVNSQWHWLATDEEKMLVSSDGEKIEKPFSYIISILSFSLCRLLGISGIATLYIVRYLNLVFFALCAYFAIRKTPTAKYIFAVVSLSPITITLACSFSYDACVISLSFVLLAILFNLIWGSDSKVSWVDLAIASVSCFIIAHTKVVYAPIGLLLFLAPKERFGSNLKKAAAIALLVLFACLGYMLYIEAFQWIHNVDTSISILSSVSTSYYTYDWLVQNPKDSCILFAKTIAHYLPEWMCGMAGGCLGWLVYRTPRLLWMVQLLLLLASAIDENDARLMPRASYRVVAIVSALVMFFGIMLAMCVGWTPLGSSIIEGVQGRYFIPFLPMILLAFRFRIPLPCDFHRAILAMQGSFAVLSFVVSFIWITVGY